MGHRQHLEKTKTKLCIFDFYGKKWGNLEQCEGFEQLKSFLICGQLEANWSNA